MLSEWLNGLGRGDATVITTGARYAAIAMGCFCKWACCGVVGSFRWPSERFPEGENDKDTEQARAQDVCRCSILTSNSQWAKRTRRSLLFRSRCFTTMSLLVSLALARSPTALSRILLARSKPASHQHRAEISSNLPMLASVYLALPTGLIDRMPTSLLPPYAAAVADTRDSRPVGGFDGAELWVRELGDCSLAAVPRSTDGKRRGSSSLVLSGGSDMILSLTFGCRCHRGKPGS
jgi:hypothetical protein